MAEASMRLFMKDLRPVLKTGRLAKVAKAAK
jgi:hypothetical protein